MDTLFVMEIVAMMTLSIGPRDDADGDGLNIAMIAMTMMPMSIPVLPIWNQTCFDDRC